MNCPRYHAFVESQDGALLFCARCGAVRQVSGFEAVASKPASRRPRRQPQQRELFDPQEEQRLREQQLLEQLEREEGISVEQLLGDLRTQQRAEAERDLVARSNDYEPRRTVEDELEDTLPSVEV